MTDPAHIDDETLSATIDGETAPTHLAECTQCSARMDRLAAAARWVATPVAPLDDGNRDVALAAARTAAGVRERAPFLRMAAVAAVILAILGVTMSEVVSRYGGGTDTVASEITPRESDAGAGGRLAESDYLGAFDDAHQLDIAVRNRLGVPLSPEDKAAGLQSAPASDSAGVGSQEAPTAARPRSDCLKLAQKGLDPDFVLELEAGLSWQGQPAYVFVLRNPKAGSLSRRTVVTSASDCSVLVVQSF